MSQTLTKTAGTTLLALQSVASNTVIVGSTVSVATTLYASVFIRIGRRIATALTVGAQVRIEASSASSGDRDWYPLFTYVSQIAAASDEAVNGVCAAGQAVVPMAATAGFTAGDVVFIDNGTIGNSEWGRVKSISANASVTLIDNLVNAQTGATVYDSAEILPGISLDVSAVTRLRAVADFSQTGQAVAVEVMMVTGDSIG